MREIKFRGKRIDNGEWVYGYIVKVASPCGLGWVMHIPAKDPDDNHRVVQVNPSTVGQYTGLKDKNGVEIYEGDIIVPPTWRYQMKLVVNFGIGIFDSGIYKFNGFYLVDENGRQGEDQYELHTDGEYKVIGNIHNNPELLGGAK